MNFAALKSRSDIERAPSAKKISWREMTCSIVVIALCVALVSATSRSSLAASDSEPMSPDRENKIKAAFLYNFAKFTAWPEHVFHDTDSPLRICGLGNDPIRSGLEAIAGKTAQKRQIATSILGQIEDSEHCHAIFIGASEIDALPEILGYFSHRPVLTVSDIDGFADAGGMIGLRTVNNKIRFTVNIMAARTGGLVLNPQVLRLADIVGHISTADKNAGSVEP